MKFVVAPTHHHFDFEQYLTLENDSNVKHEFVDGRVYAMAGGTPEHSAIAMNVGTLLNVALGTRRCRVFNSDLRIFIRASKVGTYPDVSVVCGQVELASEDRHGQSALNPTVLVEVLSPSTSAYDQGEKLDYYKQIPSLQEVMLVHHDVHRVVVWRRTGSTWSSLEFTDLVELRSIDCKLGLDEIYRDPLA